MAGTTTDGARAIASPMNYLETDLIKLLDAISGTPGSVRELEDHQLLALAAWTQDGNEHIRLECVRRAESGRKFARYLDLSADTPWPEARAIIGERVDDLRNQLLDQALQPSKS